MDPNIVTFVVEYYQTLAEIGSNIEGVYYEGAKLVVFQGKDSAKVYVSNYDRVLVKGKRKITLVSGTNINSHLYIHVQSEMIQKNQKIVFDEVFNCGMSDTSIFILYHTIHINPLLEPITVLPPPPPKIVVVTKKVEKKFPPAEEVATPDPMKKSNCLFVNNLPFKTPPKDFLPIMEKHGRILRYCQQKGKLIVEYEKIDDLYKAKESYYEEWNGRMPKIFRPPKDYKWE